MKYNPAFLSQEELIESFVVRKADFEFVLEIIRENTGPSNQHVLVVGPRGLGKTTLVRRVAAEIERDADLSQRLYPVIFSEETYEACSVGELWLEALFHISEKENDGTLRETYKALKTEMDETRLRERTLARLLDFADSQGKRLVLVLENLNTLLTDQISDGDAWALRDTLQNEPRIILLTTSVTRFRAIERADKALYDLFVVHDLKPLTLDECHAMWLAVAGTEPPRNKLRPIQILTGGNPRLLYIISTFATKSSFRELMHDLTGLVDEHTEYFRSHMENLPPVERKIFTAVLDIWDPVSAKQAGEYVRVSTNKASALLNRLASKGAVVVSEEGKGKKYYQASERLFNIYHLMRRRGGPSDRARAAIEFMTHLYEGEEIVAFAQGIGEEACSEGVEACPELVHAFHALLCHTKAQACRETILQQTPKQILDAMENLTPFFGAGMAPAHEEGKKATATYAVTGEEIRDGRPREVKNAKAWFSLGVALSRLPDRLKDATHAYEKVIEIKPDNHSAWTCLGFAYRRLEKYEKAINAYKKAIEIKPDNHVSWVDLGITYRRMDKVEKAIDSYKKALEIYPHFHDGWCNLGAVYSNDDRLEDAVQALKKALDIEPDCSVGWSNLGNTYLRLKKPGEAVNAYKKSLKIKPDNHVAWVNLGIAYFKTNRLDEAINAYKKSLKIKSDDHVAWVKLGIAYRHIGKVEKAIGSYKKALETNSKFHDAWCNLGNAYLSLNKFDEATSAYKKALAIESDCYGGWLNLGIAFRHMGNRDEAVGAYKKTLGIKPNNLSAWIALSDIYPLMGLFEDAKVACNKALEVKPDDYAPWINLGNVYAFMGRHEDAVVTYNKALHQVALFLKEGFDQKSLDGIINFFIDASAAGYAEQSLQTIIDSPVADKLETLAVGLRIHLGEKPRVAREIYEMGLDIAERIKKRQQEMEKIKKKYSATAKKKAQKTKKTAK